MIKIDNKLNESSGNQKVFVEHYHMGIKKLDEIKFYVILRPNHEVVHAGFYRDVDDRRDKIIRDYRFASVREYETSDIKRKAYEVAFVDKKPLWKGLVEDNMHIGDVWEGLEREGVVEAYETFPEFRDWLSRRRDKGRDVIFALRDDYTDFRTIDDIHLRILDAEPEDFDVT